MPAKVGDSYSSDWVSEAGLSLGSYCITLVRGVGPREALRRLGVGDAAIQNATWREFMAQYPENLPEHFTPGIAAAFVIGEHVVLVEDVGYRGRRQRVGIGGACGVSEQRLRSIGFLRRSRCWPSTTATPHAPTARALLTPCASSHALGCA